MGMGLLHSFYLQTKMRKLSESEEERLIDQVKQYPILYDESYKVAGPQDEIWKRIALDLNLDGKYTALWMIS